VDNAVMILREYRYFHKFGDEGILLDVIWQELKLDSSDPLIMATPGDVRSRVQLDKKLQRDPNMLSQILPVVNAAEDIERHYHIMLSS
jgi:hypothetical protein